MNRPQRTTGRGQPAAPPTPDALTTIRKSKGPRGGTAAAFAGPVVAIAVLAAVAAWMLPAASGGTVARIGFPIVAVVALVAARAAAAPIAALLADVDALSRGGQPRAGASGPADVAALGAAIRAMWANLKRGERLRRDFIDADRDAQAAAALFERQRPTTFTLSGAISVSAAYKTRDTLGGTLVTAHDTRDGRAIVCLFGASGDGTAAALLLASARAYAKALAPDATSPRRFLKDLNALLAPELPHGTFVTAAVVLVDASGGACAFASAGHRVAALRVKSGGSARRLQTEGIALGFDTGPVFERSLEEAPFTLDADEACLLASEGLAAATIDGTSLGESGIARAAVGPLRAAGDDAPAVAILDGLGPIVHPTEATLVVVRRLEPGASA